jgi:hypothetical protein
MTDIRLLKYPNGSLADAVSKAKMIYAKEHMSAMTPPVAAEAMGYKGISGASLAVIADLKKYGLLEGRGDQVRLTKDAQVIAIDDPTSGDYKAAMCRSALKPDMFVELDKQFSGVGSERNIAVYLEKQGFKPDAAATIAKNYKENLGLMGGKPLGQHQPAEDAVDMITQAIDTARRQDGAASYSMPMSAPKPAQFTASGRPNETIGTAGAPFRIVMNGDKLHIEADVDLKGLQLFKQMLDGYENMLKLLPADLSNAPSLKTE